MDARRAARALRDRLATGARVAGLVVFASGCTAAWKDRTTNTSRFLAVLTSPAIHRLSSAERAPRSPGEVEIVYQPGFFLGVPGRAATSSMPWWLSSARREWEELAEIEVARREPDHEQAVLQLQDLAARLGAYAIVEVGYTLWVTGDHEGGSSVGGWIYHGLAVTRAAPAAESSVP